MYRSSYLREVHKEKYERSDTYDDKRAAEFIGLDQAQGFENLQELNERFAKYINRARVLEQRNAVFRKQLETLQRMEEISNLEETFSEQIGVNRQRIRELSIDRVKLERELKDAQRTVDEFQNKYRNECDYQQHLRDTLDSLNKDADEVLLNNLELQIQSQFLQDDINATKERHKKNLMEIQTYVNILQQILQTTPRLSSIATGKYEEKLLSERRVPSIQSQLEEYKSARFQLQAQKQKLQNETAVLEQAIKNTQESYDDEIQLYNDQIENLRKEIEEAERTLEKYTNDYRQIILYQQSLENELERYKRIIENEDNRLNCAIVGTPVIHYSESYRYSRSPPTQGKDITLAIHDIATAKPRQKGQKKVLKKKEITTKEGTNGDSETKTYERTLGSSDQGETAEEGKTGEVEIDQELAPEDVPDGAQLSKAFDTLCNIVRERMRRYKRPEPIADYFTKGRYVLVTGEASYIDPFFCSSSPAAGRVIITLDNGMIPDYNGDQPQPEPQPEPEPQRKDNGSLDPDRKKEDKNGDKGKGTDGEKGGGDANDKKSDGKEEPTKPSENKDPEPKPAFDPGDPDTDPSRSYFDKDNKRGKDDRYPSSEIGFPNSRSYEKVEVVESVEEMSDDKIQAFEETAMIVETTIEKTSKKKHSDKSF
uniref:Filensin n=1 Tax=Latimeria chalumnae TaxID=7897 RepID=H3AZF7_LATCH